MDQTELCLVFHIVGQHEIERGLHAFVEDAGKNLRHPLGLNAQIGIGRLAALGITRPGHRHIELGDPHRSARRDGAEVGVNIGILPDGRVVVQIEGVEIGPGLVGMEVGQDGLGMVGENVLASDDPGVARLQAQVTRLLERGDFAADVAAEDGDVGLVPGLEGQNLARPPLGHRLVETVGMAEVGGKPPGAGPAHAGQTWLTCKVCSPPRCCVRADVS